MAALRGHRHQAASHTGLSPNNLAHRVARVEQRHAFVVHVVSVLVLGCRRIVEHFLRLDMRRLEHSTGGATKLFATRLRLLWILLLTLDERLEERESLLSRGFCRWSRCLKTLIIVDESVGNFG